MVMSTQTPESILDQWQSWGEEFSHRPGLVSQLNFGLANGGLTNKSYVVDSSIGKLVLRINNPHSEDLGINRERESLILAELNKLSDTNKKPGIAPDVVYQDPQYQYLIYQFIEGKLWTKADISDEQNQQRIKQIIDQYQQIQLSTEPRNYKNYLLHYWQQLEAKNLIDNKLQQEWTDFLSELDKTDWTAKLCHHDLVPENIIETPEGLRIIDWEYAHMGHPDLDWFSITQGSTEPSIASKLIYWMNRLWHLVQ